MSGDGWDSGGGSGLGVHHDPGSDELALAVVVGAQFALRIGEQIRSSSRHQRWDQARHDVNRRAGIALARAQISLPGHHLGQDNAGLLKGKLSDNAGLALLLSATSINPVDPYEVEIKRSERNAGLQRLAQDLGCPRNWAEIVIDAGVEAGRHFHSGKELLGRIGTAALPLALSPWIMVAGAMTGLAGMSTVVSAVRRVGPGDMLGGLSLARVSAQGAGPVVEELVRGNRIQVQQNVIFLLALGLAKVAIRPRPRPQGEWATLLAMRSALEFDLSLHQRIDERTSGCSGDLRGRISDINKAIDVLLSNGIGG